METGLSRQRRAVLKAAGALAAGALAVPRLVSSAQAAHVPEGPVSPPTPAPSLWLTRDDGARFELRQHLLGKLTVAQVMFTSCTATCPLQGALFAATARKAAGTAGTEIQFLSISIDPARDTPAKLAAWLKGFGATAVWRAAAPKPDEVDKLFDFFRGRADGVDRHSAAAYVLDRKARLAFRSSDLPRSGDLLSAIGHIAKRG
jgi:protein SCO1/2